MTSPKWVKEFEARRDKSPAEQLAEIEQEEKSEKEDRPETDVLYHYTDAAGFLGVLGRGEIWATEVRCMNDAQEIEYAASVVAAECKELGDQFVSWKAAGLPLPPDVNGIARWCRENLDVEGGAPYPSPAKVIYRLAASFAGIASSRHQSIGPSTYAACFTTESDSLGQWRGYAGGKGYAIGFRFDALGEAKLGLAGKTVGAPRRVLYGEKGGREQAARLYRHIGKLLLTAAQTLRRNEEARAAGEPVMQERKHVGSYGPKLQSLATVKHEAFKDEREWRLVISEEDDELGELVPDFRPGGVGGVLPFLRLTLPEGAIASVRVGPGEETDLRVLTAKQALARYGYRDVEVLTAAAPYRP
ncbi:DUF2971 domain-containing protein [Rhodococcus pyridinivorans]|uniref:DUF2971 domain-containing protein n=1 Tax=Rhodococcus pyridinivorans TaxID=103816 RepID=UPI00110F4B63|nr:DUF2971 domain-containing protein [Rhodococcus pyridinivorans]